MTVSGFTIWTAARHSGQIRVSQTQSRRSAANNRSVASGSPAEERVIDGARQELLLGAQLAYGPNRGRRRAPEAGSTLRGSLPTPLAKCNRFSVGDLLVGTAPDLILPPGGTATRFLNSYRSDCTSPQ